MTKRFLAVVTAVLLIAVVLFLIWGSGKDKFKIVHITGVDLSMNIYANYGYFVGNGPDSTSALPLYDQDVLYLGVDEFDEVAFYRYLKSDGSQLDFSWDGFRLSLNDEIIFARVEEDDTHLEWLQSLANEKTILLRTLSIEADLPVDYWEALEKIAEVKQNISLVLESGTMPVKKLLSLFNPPWILDDEHGDYDEKDLDMLHKADALEFLYLPDVSLINFEKLAKLPSLESIIVYDDSDGDLRELQHMKQLISLSIIDGDFSSLNDLPVLPNLKELNLTTCENLTDLSGISDFTSLRRLSLINCDQISGLDELKNLTRLEYLSLPNNVSQEAFDLLIPELTTLDILKLVECEQVTNVDAIAEIPGLDCLIITNDDLEPESIYELNHLSYLAYPAEVFEDSTVLNELKEQLPKTILVPTDAFCMGSGWLLVLIPLALVLLILTSRIKRSERRSV